MKFPTSLHSTRSIFWPIFGKEHFKFLPLAFMMFFILLDYSLMRSVKDALVVTEVGPEAIGFIKTYFVFPSAILMTALYYKLCNIMDPKKVFYVIAGMFLLYFTVFSTVVFPNMPQMLLSQDWADSLTASSPRLKWFVRIFQYWPHTTFYIASELWGSTMISLFFWQLANQITNPSEAKRHYAMFGLLGNLGLIATSTLIEQTMQPTNRRYDIVFGILIVSIAAIVSLYYFLQNYVATRADLIEGVIETKKKKKAKPSIAQSIQVIFSSPYLGLLALLLIAYGVSNILVETIWKQRVGQLHPDPAAYLLFMGQYQKYLGVTTMFFTLVGSNILRFVTWTQAAIITPLMFTITAGLFFLFILGSQGGDAALLSSVMNLSDALFLSVIIGGSQNVLSKATKYSLFDSTQKMAYMPLNEELKTKGMSAVEVIGGRFGKMGGGIITSTLLTIFPMATLLDLTPALALFCAVIVVIWVLSVFSLGKKYHAEMDARLAESNA